MYIYVRLCVYDLEVCLWAQLCHTLLCKVSPLKFRRTCRPIGGCCACGRPRIDDLIVDKHVAQRTLVLHHVIYFQGQNK